MSASVKSRLRNGPVSSGVEGPPMFIMSTAVFGRTPDEDDDEEEDGDDAGVDVDAPREHGGVATAREPTWPWLDLPCAVECGGTCASVSILTTFAAALASRAGSI